MLGNGYIKLAREIRIIWLSRDRRIDLHFYFWLGNIQLHPSDKLAKKAAAV